MPSQIQHLEAAEVYGFLDTRAQGLAPGEVAERLAQLGPNTLEGARGGWWIEILVRQFLNFFSILLDLSAAICFLADRLQPGEHMDVLGWALLGVSVLNALFGFVQEFRAERAMEELKKFLPRRVAVRREGRESLVDAEELVPGDVLLVHEGDQVPADARIVEAGDLLVNNAPLTGESNPVTLVAGAADAALVESPNLVFAGCTVLRGSALAVVFATGLRTEFGRIASLSQRIRRKLSPLERETGHMVRVLTAIAVVMGVAFFAYGVLAGRSLWVNLVFMLGIIVANVPEGLLPTFTLSLAMSSLRMARKNVLVKSLNAVEAMGSVHVICTDKTGTLTLNRLSVTRVASPLTGAELEEESSRRRLLDLALVASAPEEVEQGFRGDPLDVCLAEAWTAAGGDAGAIPGMSLRHFAFDADKRRAAGVGRAGERTVFAVKGAWESLRPLLGRVEDPATGRVESASEALLARCDEAVQHLARDGHRVIAIASRELDAVPSREGLQGARQEELESGLALAGLLGLGDPIRPEVPDAVARCLEAGIGTLMITGDHPETAAAVARRAGLLPPQADTAAAVLTGGELEDLHESELIERLEQGCTVFARTTPAQKMKIVAALHEMDRVVAVTGDGVNDAPALKAADVGIAMGASGTDVAREAAQVILLDDNFASIVAGVAEGRTIFSNIRKFTNYVLVSNGPEILPYLIYILFPVPLALTVIQILSIDLGTDIVPSIGLGQERPDPGVMRQPPRDGRRGLLRWPLIAHSYLFLGLIEAAFSLGLFFWVLVQGGWEYGRDLGAGDPLYRSATGIALASIMLMQIGNLVGRRSRYGSGLDRYFFTNPFMVCGVAFEIAFSWALLYFPPLGRILGTGPVAPGVYAVAWLGVPLIFGLDWVRKQVARRIAAAGSAGTAARERA